MKFIINELSFIGQATGGYDADNLMKELTEVVKAIKPLQGNEPVYVHEDFANRQISKDYTVYKWAVNQKQNSSDRDLAVFFIQLCTNAPFVLDILNQDLANWKCEFQNQDYRESSLAGAAYLEGVLISLQNASDFSDDFIEVRFSINQDPLEIKNIQNLTTIHQAQKLRPKYNPSAKHRNQGERGKKGTIMDLSDTEAQQVLEQAYVHKWLAGKKYYGYKNDKFYEFQPDNVGSYHGYPVDRNEVPDKVLQEIVKYFKLSF